MRWLMRWTLRRIVSWIVTWIVRRLMRPVMRLLMRLVRRRLIRWRRLRSGRWLAWMRRAARTEIARNRRTWIHGYDWTGTFRRARADQVFCGIVRRRSGLARLGWRNLPYDLGGLF